MTSIVELFPKCRKLAYDARQQFSQLQNNSNNGNGSNGSGIGMDDLQLTLEELNRQLTCMEQLLHYETPLQRDVWKRKILELRQDGTMISNQAIQYDRMVHSNARQEQERNELLRRRRKRRDENGSSSNHHNPEHDLNNLAEEAQSLHQSHLMVDDLLTTGSASLQGLVQQRNQMRGIRRMVTDMSHRLGLSQTTMRIIERRDITDLYLVLAGMIITCIVIYFCYFHF